MNEKTHCVYCHTNKINGKKYIGQTCQSVSDRWGSNGRGYKKSPTHFWYAIKKYGWSNFEHEIIKDNLTLDEANFWEEYYINLFNTTNENYGYNCRHGGKAGLHTENTKKKMSESAYKRFENPEEHKKISLGKTNPSEETRRKYSEWQKGEKSWRYGRKDTPEEIEQKRHSPKCKSVIAINIKTGERKPYYSASEAARQLGLDPSSILKVCNNKLKTHKGYIFIFQ